MADVREIAGRELERATDVAGELSRVVAERTGRRLLWMVLAALGVSVVVSVVVSATARAVSRRRADDQPDETLDAVGAAEILGVRVDRIEVLVEQGMLDPADGDERRFRPEQVEAVRLAGA